MPRKRKCSFVDVGTSDCSDGADDDDLHLSDNSSGDNESNRSSFDGFIISDDSLCDDMQCFNDTLYKQYLKECCKLKKLKKKLLLSMSHTVKKKKPDGRPKIGFSRFSVSTFSSVIASLSPGRRDVIRKFGFGSLLLFYHCAVPRNFVHWVARLVNFHSGDIVVNGKVISLTKEAVHLVLDLPFGGEPFPADYSVGKAALLSRFGKESVPSINFFADSLTSGQELSDEDMFVCFIVVAMSTFLCPNSSIVPSQKFFGIFEDLDKIRGYDWCGYILAWLLEYIKLFNQLKSCKSTQQATLGGCLYFLAVLYLDHVDFGSHQVPSTIPRISVWKKDMIKQYAALDIKEEGCFGYHPIMDYSRTCYAKDMRLLPQIIEQNIDPEFLSRLDSYARCKLPTDLKDAICRLIEKHCLNCGVSVNFDVNAMNALSDDMRLTFIKLWKHVYSVSKMSQLLVLEIIKLLSESIENDENIGSQFDDLGASPVCSQRDRMPATSNGNENIDPELQEIHPSQYKLQKSLVDACSDVPEGSSKMKYKGSPDVVLTNSKSMSNSKNPLADISNSKNLRQGSLKKSMSNAVDTSPVLDVDNENKYVPDSISPSSVPGYSRFFSQKHSNVSATKKNQFPCCNSPLIMQTLDLTQYSPSPYGSVKVNVHNSGAKLRSSSKLPDKISGEDDVVPSKPSLSNSHRKVSDEVLVDGSKPSSAKSSCQLNGSNKTTPVNDFHGTHDDSLPSYARLTQSFVVKSHDLTSGGKLPLHGPRRFVTAGPLFHGDYETEKPKFCQVSKSELENYEILCKLASSEFQCEDAVNLSSVRCTFWSLGESLKPGGFVNSFVVSCYCYSLFSKPNGHPDPSKRHYFFANIGDCLLLDYEEADQKMLQRSFRRASKARPLHQSNMLFFPILRQNHWFVFVVDIKDRHFVILDSLYNQNSKFHQEIEDKLISSFRFYWNKFVQVDMDFNFYGLQYPKVPDQPFENSCDSGIYAMMFLEHWTSPRVMLRNMFSSKDIPSIRVKIANDLFFHHKNIGMKHRLYDFSREE